MIPQINFDQMNVMSYQHHAAIKNTAPWSDPHNPPHPTDASIFAAMERGQVKPCFMRAYLLKQSDWMDWSISEYKQLSEYHTQGMFGAPVHPTRSSNILPLIWTYLIKSDGTKKARCVCNESP